MHTQIVTALVAASVILMSGPATAVDADRRLGDDDPGHSLLAPAKPQPDCLVVRVVPIVSLVPGDDLLYRPCDSQLLRPRDVPDPWGVQRPHVVPVERSR